jgi:hypothetical protein
VRIYEKDDYKVFINEKAPPRDKTLRSASSLLWRADE